MFTPKDIDVIIASVEKESAVCEANMSRITEHIYSGAPVAMISADRVEYNRKQKESARKRLRIDINSSGYSYITLNGTWNSNGNVSDEVSFLVLGIDREGNETSFEDLKDFALECCQKYQQECVIVGYSLHSGDYKSEIHFELLGADGDVWNEFKSIKFGTPESIERLHERYIKYREMNEEGFNAERDDFGFGYTRKGKNKSSFSMLNKDEAKLK